MAWCQGVSVGREQEVEKLTKWAISSSWLQKWPSLGACRLSPVRVALLQQQPKRLPKKQRRMQINRWRTPVGTHHRSHFLWLFGWTPLLPHALSSPPLSCCAHGAKRGNSTAATVTTFLSPLSVTPGTNQLFGVVWYFLVARVSQLWLTLPTKSSSFRYKLHTEPPLLPICSDPPPPFLTAVQSCWHGQESEVMAIAANSLTSGEGWGQGGEA